MKKYYKIIISALTIISILSIAGCGSAKKEVTLGTLENNTYTNDFFGITMDVPADWNMQDQDIVDQMYEEGKEQVAGDNKLKEKVLDLAKQNVLNFMTCFKYPLDEQKPVNPNYICNAEKLSVLQGVKTEKDYLESVKKTLAQTQNPLEFNKEVYTETLGGKEFSVLEGTVSAGDIVATQKYYTVLIDKYAFNIIVMYSNQDGQDEIEAMLKSVKFSE